MRVVRQPAKLADLPRIMTKNHKERKGATASQGEQTPGTPGALTAYFTGEEVTADLPSASAPSSADPCERNIPTGGGPHARIKRSDSTTPIIFSPVAAARTPTPDATLSANRASDSAGGAVPRWVSLVMIVLTVSLAALVAALLTT